MARPLGLPFSRSLSFALSANRPAQDLPDEKQPAPGIGRRGCELLGMKTITRTFLTLTILAASLWITSPSARADEVIYSQFHDYQSAYGPSLVWTPNGVNSEVADEFNVVANIDRVYAGGFVWGTVSFQGAYVRFYEFGADNKPGALQREYFFAPGDPNATLDQNGGITANLSPAFAATGRHFLTVQPVMSDWSWWSSSSGAPRGEAFYFRDNTAGEAWHHGDNLSYNINADVVFSLYGTVTGAGTITSLSETTLPRSGYLEIFGTNFGGDGTVLIGGISAPVADWTSTRVIAYVPESAPLATLPVQVVSGAGGSNTVSLAVTTRPPTAGHVNWRFRMNGPYSFVRPVIGPDGTIYSIDKFNHLYALTPDGGLKWLVRGAGDKGVAVGSDSSIYVASENFINAYNQDGSAKWQFVQNPRAFICLGVSVGPDGNIYSVGTEGPGVFSLTPAGALRWQQPEAYNRPIVEYGEIVFGPNGGNQQLYFYTNGHARALRLDGTPVFEIGGLGQPVIGPDGSVHGPLAAYSPSGSQLWFFNTPFPYNVFTTPDVGSDGTHYFGQNLSKLFALNPDGSQHWLTNVNGYVDGPVVDSLNTQLVMGSQDTGDHAGFVLSTSAQDGHELWRVILPIEDPTVWNPGVGIFGFNHFIDTRARFTPNGQTAYIITGTATGDNNTSKSFVYSLDAVTGAPTPSPSPSPSPGISPSPSPSPSPGTSPSPSPSPSPGTSPSPSPSPSPGISPSPSPSPSPGISPSPSPSPSPGTSPSPSPSPSPGISPSPSPGPIPPSKAINLSTRVRVQTGDNVGIGGFIITGTAPKHVLLRVIGPSLTQVGVPDALANPMLELYGPGDFVTMANDNWRDTQETAIQATGIPPTNNLESAIDATLAPGAYTAIVRGNGDTSGVALVEVYDLNPAADSKLANLSTRAFVSTGDNIVIAGFMLGSNPSQAGNDRIVVRGIGPSLALAGVPNALVNPALELRDNNGALLIANDNWQDNTAQAAELTAAGLAPASPLESGIATALPPGLYTALLTGLDNSTGIGVVEVYDRGAQ